MPFQPGFSGWLVTLMMLSGCTTFDQRYEQVELKSPARPVEKFKPTKLTEFIRPGKTTKPEARGQNAGPSSSRPASISALKPVTSLAKPSSNQAPNIQLASFEDPFATTSATDPEPPPVATEAIEQKAPQSPAEKDPAAKESQDTQKSISVPAPDEASAKVQLDAPGATTLQPLLPMIDPPDPNVPLVTMEQAVQECEASFLLAAAGEGMQQAYADYVTSTLYPNPTISTTTSLQPFPGRPFSPTRQGGPPQYDLGINYPLDWLLWGKRRAAMATTSAWTQVAESDYQDIVRLRVAQTRSAFFDVLEARELRDLSRQDVGNLRQVQEMTENQIKVGGASAVERDRVKLALLNAERDLQVRETALKNLKSQLRYLMGRTEADPDFEVSGSLDIINPVPPLPKEELLQIAQQSRPDIISARKQLDWASNAIGLEQRRAKPQFNGSFGLTYQQQKKAIGFPDQPSMGGGVSFSVPLFDRNQGNITKAQSVYAQASYNLQARLSSLQSEVDQATASYNAAYQAVTSINVEQSQAALNVRNTVAKAYDAGDRPLIEVLDTERAYRDTARLVISGRASYWKSLYQLNSVTGTAVTP